MALTDNLISVWHMNNDWQDSWGTNHGTATGAIFSTSAKLGSHAGSFDGIDDYVTVGDGASLQVSTLSFASWIKRSDAARFLDLVFVGGSGEYGFYTYATKLGFGRIAVSETLSNTITWDTNWHFVVITYDSGIGQAKFYFDNVLVGTTSYSNPGFVSGTKAFGRRPDVSGNEMSGKIDEAVLWGRVLSAAEVSELWNGGVGIEIWRLLPERVLRGVNRGLMRGVR